MGIRTFIDRIFPWTIICGPLAYSTLQLRSVLSDNLSLGSFLGVTVFYLYQLVFHWNAERKIDALGKRAPVVRTWTPFNIGFLLQAIYYFRQNRNHELWHKLFKVGTPDQHYTVEAMAVGQRLIVTADEENIKAILASQFNDYGKGPQFRKEWKDFLGLSIFTTDGQLWHDSRQLLRPQFIKDRVSDLQTFEHHVQKLLPLMEGTSGRPTVQVDDLMYRFTLDAATDFLLGRSVDSLENGQTEFATAFAQVQGVQATMARAGPLKNWVPRKEFDQGLSVLNKFVDKYIDQALALSQDELEKKSKSDEGYTFLHAIATYTRNRQMLRDQLVAVLLAGRDTTAVTLSWLLYELSRNPQIVQKLRAEIIDRVGLDRVPTYDDLKNMRYLQHVLNETLRLYPVVPYNVRVALQDTCLPTGGGPDGTEPIGIPEGTPVGYSTFILQRREDIYPSTSTGFASHLEFVPERWDSWTPKSWSYIPFNGGPRICIGQQFALTEMGYTVTRILQTFDHLEDRNSGFPGTKTEIVLSPANGVYVNFRKTQKS